MNIERLFLAFLTIAMIAPFSQMQPAQVSLSKRVDEKIAKVVGKDNVKKTKKIIASVAGATAVVVGSWFTLRFLFKPCLEKNPLKQNKSKKSITEVQGTNLATCIAQDQNQGAHYTLTKTEEKKAAAFKRFFRAFFCVKPIHVEIALDQQLVL